jgi:hypothetical protein
MKKDERCFNEVRELLAEISLPLHQENIRDLNRKIGTREADMSIGYRLTLPEDIAPSFRATAEKDFQRFMSVCLDVPRKQAGYNITLCMEEHSWPDGVFEPYHIAVRKNNCIATARDEEGLRRALCFLEDEMSLRRGPFLPIGSFSRWTTMETRITRSPCAPYRWKSGWELLDNHDYYPEEYLNKLAHCGINGIWVAGLFRNMIASKTLPELGPKRHRLNKLKQIVDKAAIYGIKVYLFCMEPRAVPNDHPVFKAHPEIRGSRMCDVTSSLCTSVPLVQEYVREITGELFGYVPGLAGLINIFNGERGTTCWLDQERALTCPRCQNRPQWEVLAEDLNLFQEGMRRTSRTGKLLAWTYAMDPNSEKKDTPSVQVLRKTIDKTNPDIVWLGNAEHGGYKNICGKRIRMEEYSLSYTGPSDLFRNIASSVQKRRGRVYAKVQVGTTYELASVPYLPVPGVVYDKIMGLRELDVSGLMASWIIGGYPSLMLKAIGEACFQTKKNKSAFLKRLAGIFWSDGQAASIANAWLYFEQSFQRYPNATDVFYHGPITRAPAYRLHLSPEPRHAEPYNMGIDKDRHPQPFEDDLLHWVGPFSAEDITDTFRTMGTIWSKGVSILEHQLEKNKPSLELGKQKAVADSILIHFRSTANIFEFYRLRNLMKNYSSSRRVPILRRLLEIIADEMNLCRKMIKNLKVEKAIGFHSEIYAYSYSKSLVDEKIRELRDIQKFLSLRLKSKGVV